MEAKPGGLVEYSSRNDASGSDGPVGLEPHEIIQLELHDQAPMSHDNAPRSHDNAPGSHDQAPRSHDNAPGSHGQAPRSHDQASLSHDQALLTHMVVIPAPVQQTPSGQNSDQRLETDSVREEEKERVFLVPLERSEKGEGKGAGESASGVSMTTMQPSPLVTANTATTQQDSSLQLETGKRRGRKRKQPLPPPTLPPSPKRPRGRPKGSGKKSAPPTVQTPGKKKRGRKPKQPPPSTNLHPPSTKHPVITSISSTSQESGVSLATDGNHDNIASGRAVPGVVQSPTVLKGTMEAHQHTVSASVTTVGVIIPATPPARAQPSLHSHAKTKTRKSDIRHASLEEKRRQLLQKARADRVRKKSETKHLQKALLTQRRMAQRQRRERERALVKEARERQDKITRQREAEDRLIRHQRVARQRELESQRRAQERTTRLLVHLRQQEIEQNRRVYQQQLDLEKAEQLKKPTEDLVVREILPLPPLPQLGWVCLPSTAFADLLMVVEFANSFDEFLELDPPPSLLELFGSLYNRGSGSNRNSEVLLRFCVSLLKAAFYDPGCNALTDSGCPVTKIEVRSDTLSELLRLYLEERVEEGVGGMEEICKSLDSLPLPSLRPSEKTHVLSFLVDELLSSPALCREVDTRMEQIASLRREKWKLSLKLKRFRSRLSAVYGVGARKRAVVYSGRGRPPKRAIMGPSTAEGGQEGGGESSDEGEDPANPATNEEEGGGASDYEYSEEETDEETPDVKEDLQKRIRELKKKLQYVRSRIHTASHLIRKFPLGQDRYVRQYWMLPSLGGVVIEGMETSLHGNLQSDPSMENGGGVEDEGITKDEVKLEEGGRLKNTVEPMEAEAAGVGDERGGEGDREDSGTPQSALKVDLAEKSGRSEDDDSPITPQGTESSTASAGGPETEVTVSVLPGGRRSAEAGVESRPSSNNQIPGMESSQKPHPLQYMASAVLPSWDQITTPPVKEVRRHDPLFQTQTSIPVASTHQNRTGMKNGNETLGVELDNPQNTNVQTRLPFADLDLIPSLARREPSSAIVETPAESSGLPLQKERTSSVSVAMSEPDATLHEIHPSVSAKTAEPASFSGTGDVAMETNSNTVHVALIQGSMEGEEGGGERGSEQDAAVAGGDLQRDHFRVDRGMEGSVLNQSERDVRSPSRKELSTDSQYEAQVSPSDDTRTLQPHNANILTSQDLQTPQRWFSILPRQPCEVTIAPNVCTAADVGGTQLQLATTQQVLAPQQYIMTAPVTQTYAYVTANGTVIGSQPLLQQMGVGYTLVGNTLVPQAQYVSVNPTQQVQYVVSDQQGVQYVAVGAQQQQQPQGVQYVSLGGNRIAVVQSGGDGQVVVAQQDVSGGVEGVKIVHGGSGDVVVDGGVEGVKLVHGGGTSGNVVVSSVEGVKILHGGEEAKNIGGVEGTSEVESQQGLAENEGRDTKSEARPGDVQPSDMSTTTDNPLPAPPSRDEEERPGCSGVTDSSSLPLSALRQSESEEIRTVLNPSAGQQQEPTQAIVQDSPQYLTAVLPSGAGGVAQYVSLPADPRVIAGQCSYAVLQQPDGSSQIVLVENTSLGTGYSQSTALSLECPPHSLMGNEVEGEGWKVDVTLMYAEHVPFLPQKQPVRVEPKEEEQEKTLLQLLGEQDSRLTHGWWQVTNTNLVERILRSLSLRGYREKGLHKALQKNREMICSSLDPSKLEECGAAFSQLKEVEGSKRREEEEEGEGEGERGEERSSPDPTADKREESRDSESEDSNDLVASDEESMEIVSKDTTLKLTNQNAATSHMTSTQQTTNHIVDGDHTTESPNEDSESKWYDPCFPGLAREAALQVLEYLEGMWERLLTAHLNVQEEDQPVPQASQPRPGSPLPLTTSSLLKLELAVDRRYLRPPLRNRKLAELDREMQQKTGRGHRGRGHATPPCYAHSEPPTPELEQWRVAVGRVRSASQLAVCVAQLDRCIAWEKSATKVFCQVCHGGENESQLLLCDGCDKGTHTYCCKPKLDSIPDGDWYCRECVISKTKLGVCDVCGSCRGILLCCVSCTKTVHKRCLNPPLNRMPTGQWKCPTCKKHPPKPRSKASADTSPKKGRGRPQDSMGMCRSLLRELEQHEDAWPFLEPVHRKKFPEYFKLVKKPMDLLTIKNKLREGKYPNKDVFASDARLVFANCSFYNEDDSEVGMAGHSMKAFFEKRWAELTR